MKELICIVCPRGCHLHVDDENGYTVTGNNCPRGAEYGSKELQNPVRTVTSTVKIEGAMYRRCPVRTSQAIPKGLMMDIMKEIESITVTSPVKRGQVIIENLLGTGADLIVTKDM